MFEQFLPSGQIPIPKQGSLNKSNLTYPSVPQEEWKFGSMKEVDEWGNPNWAHVYGSQLAQSALNGLAGIFGNTDAQAVQNFNRNVDPTSYLPKNPNYSQQAYYGVREDGGELDEGDDWIFEDDPIREAPKVVDSVKEKVSEVIPEVLDEENDYSDIRNFSKNARWKTILDDGTVLKPQAQPKINGIQEDVQLATKELMSRFPGLKVTSGLRSWGDNDAHPIGKAMDVSGDSKTLTEAAKYYEKEIVPKYKFNKALPVNHGTGPHIHVGYYEDGGGVDPTLLPAHTVHGFKKKSTRDIYDKVRDQDVDAYTKLMKLGEKYGFSTLKTSDVSDKNQYTGGTSGASYNVDSNTISIYDYKDSAYGVPKDQIDAQKIAGYTIEELAHKIQYDKEPIKSDLRNRWANVLAKFGVDAYDDKGSLEYDAHKVISPKLKKEAETYIVDDPDYQFKRNKLIEDSYKRNNQPLYDANGTSTYWRGVLFEDGGSTGDPIRPEQGYQANAKLAYYKEQLNNKLKEKNPEAYQNYFSGLGQLRRKGDSAGINNYIQNTPYNDYLTPQEIQGTLGQEYSNYLDTIRTLNPRELMGNVEGEQSLEQLNYGRRFASLPVNTSLDATQGNKRYTRNYKYDPKTGVTFEEQGDQSIRPSYFNQDVAKFKKGGKTKMKKYEMGGTYELSDKEIQSLRDQGYDLEIL